MSSHLTLVVDSLSTFSLAAQQNAYPLLKTLRLEYTQQELSENEPPLKPLRNLKIVLQPIPMWLEQATWLVDVLLPDQFLSLPLKDVKIPFEMLFGLTEELTLDLQFDVLGTNDEILTSVTRPVSVLPANYWGGESRQPDLLAAFVKPNGVYVESLMKQAADVLSDAGHGRNIDGYQSNTREKPYLMLAALWNVVFNQQLAYVSPPKGFARAGQRIRLASDISNSKIAACLDTSLLFASCIEAMGLNAIVAISEGHAFAGAWLIDERLPVLTNDDPMDIRKRVDNRDMVLFETTLVSNPQPVTFEQAKEHARNLIAEENEHEFVFVIDIAQARARQIKPLSTVEASRDEVLAKGSVRLELPVVPPLPPVRADERVQEETPETRIDAWSRKLLDLTERNSLLNFSERAISIRLFCPDIAAMEDQLADGGSFKFLSSEESPINDRNRDAESFRMQSGSDLHRQYALQQLEKHVLVANQSSKKLEASGIALFRKAKNDLEEGGSNTLYLALGMLKWKENPEDSRSYRAPLILIPVVLQRKSARSPVTLQQLQDEDPIFNLTLIEFLQSEHDINLSEFRDALPVDESGVDVPLVWHRVREAVSEHRGFEVAEELVLASFTFAKYLMWKDLRDRIDDLKENPFVKHLVDSPREPYSQTAEFVERDTVDEKIDPAQVFTPLNCDSSQLVAVEASGRAQDFVLEGPPGTGKSETIANIIAHNIGKGRKVLFVAEKMAALNVVFRRMQKIGLDHLCLELHSNKTNKRAVLDQLGRAWQQRQGLNQAQWLEHVEALKQQRDNLNAYVRALHNKSACGVSARDAISAIALAPESVEVKLGWPQTLESSPISSSDDLKKLRETIKELALAFDDINGLEVNALSSISAVAWSNAWQSNIVDKLSDLRASLPALNQAAVHWLKIFDLNVSSLTPGHLNALESLGVLIDLAISTPIDFALQKGAKDRLVLLGELALKKQAFDAALKNIGKNATPERLLLVPIDHWLQLEKESNSGWFKAFFIRRKINAEANKLGFFKFDDLNIVKGIASAIDSQKDVLKIVEQLKPFTLWHGWGTTPKELEEAKLLGDTAHKALAKVLTLVDDPLKLIIPIRKWLIDGRDYLEESQVASAWHAFKDNYQSFGSLVNQLAELGYSLPPKKSLKSLAESIHQIVTNKVKLKSWCEWQGAKKAASDANLNDFVSALEAGHIASNDIDDKFYKAFCGWLAPLLIDADPILREFKSSSHERTIEKFRVQDAKLASITSEYVIAQASAKIPPVDSRSNPPEFGVLAREIQKKSRHIPTRALIDELGESLLSLCPCLMMSPMSVAQFLPSDFRGFDLVVFDEASQMTTWDSVGAIARGKNVIVVGDPKQMPPTNFFAAAASGDDPEEEDLESILDQALAARLPLKRLMGHYRSRHETLIAFSNSKYYENSLVTYPSSDTKESAVTLHRVNGAYAKGKGRNNPIEAQAVVDEIVRRLTSKSEKTKSLGVVTLNTDQQRTIEDLLDNARRTYPDIERFFQTTDTYDGVFVKNLESVQGDERDIIILSLGYGPTEVGGKTMSMNFGPLNKTGGERRLNVAITRATTEVLVFSSFDSSMIDLSRTSSVAVEHLKHYLEFAERGPKALAEQSTAAYGVDQFDSDFEKAVAFALRDKGWKVQTQIGVSKFKVDLGVIHPDKPGIYLAGVECDGATYHSSPSARDRDRVRHAILENLNWRIIRLWSTDYFVDSESAIDKIDAKLSELLSQDRELDENNCNEEPAIEVTPSFNDLTLTSIDDVLVNSSESPEEKDQNADYFSEAHKPVLADMAKEVLSVKPGITLQVLALDIANMHGLKRTSTKQISHLKSLIEPWAGISEITGQKPTVWPSPDDVTDEITWRGVEAFGYTRLWNEIAYPEVLGLARYALTSSPQDPVGFICDEFKLKRRYEKTLSVFAEWVEAAKSHQ